MQWPGSLQTLYHTKKIDLSVKLPHAKLLGTLLEATSRKRINKKEN